MPIVLDGGFVATSKQYSPLAKSFTVFAATNMHASYPATRIAVPNPRRFARSSSTTAPVFTLNLGAPTTIQAFSIENVNFGTLTIEGSNSSGSGFTQLQTFSVSTAERWTTRRKLICVPSSTWTFQYVRLTPASLDAGATFFKVGMVGAWPLLKTLSQNVATGYSKQLPSKAEELQIGGSEEVGMATPTRTVITATVRPETTDTATLNQYAELANIPKNRVFLWYDNEGDLTQVHHMQRTGDFEVVREGVESPISGIQFREVL